MSHYTIEAGLLMRRHVRRELMSNGFVFTEDKGLIDSLFVVKGPAHKMAALHRWVNRIEAETA